MQILIKKVQNGYTLQIQKGIHLTDFCFEENENASALSACLQYTTQVLRNEECATGTGLADPYQRSLDL